MTRISLLLAGCMCVLPFLLPYHQLPIKSFQAEWLAAALGTAAALALLLAPASEIRIPVSARWLMAFALLLLAHAWLGNPAYPQLPMLGVIYVMYASLMIWLGAQLAASSGLIRLATSLAIFLLIGAIATAAAGLIQFYGRPTWLEDFVAELHGSRAYGNIAQFNLYSIYLAWGMASLVFLWIKGHVPTGWMLAGTALLNLAVVLSSSRAWLLYLCWIALLLYLSCKDGKAAEAAQRRKMVTVILAMTAIIQISVPWINSYLDLGPLSQGGLGRAISPNEYTLDGRWQAWLLAWKIFTDNMLLGTGLGEFAGAAFQERLPDLMANQGTVWTSPHNILMQLLAETGIPGAILVAGAMGTWWYRATRACRIKREASMGWIIAVVGVVTIQSLLEYPLWNAHFLGVTALLMGTAEGPTAPNTQRSGRVSRTVAGGTCLAIALALAIILRDYVRFDSVLITGTAQTLSSEAQRLNDNAVILEVAKGPLKPVAELWLMRGISMNRADLTDKLEMSGRVLRYWPENSIVVKRAAFLALAGQTAEAQQLFTLSLETFPAGCSQARQILAQTDASASAAILPLLDVAARLAPDCS